MAYMGIHLRLTSSNIRYDMVSNTTAPKKHLDPIAGALEHSCHRSSLVLVDDSLDTGVCSYSDEHNTTRNQKEVDNDAHPVGNWVVLLSHRLVRSTHAEVGHTPKDEAEPRVEQRRH